MFRNVLAMGLLLLIGGCSGTPSVEDLTSDQPPDMRNEFAKVIEAQDFDTAKQYLQTQPLLVNEPNTLNNRTPLLVAAKTGNAQIIQWLLENGADKSAMTEEGETAFDLATANGAGDDVLALLKVQ